MSLRRSASQRRPAVSFNFTPLIDVIFLLTIFFMLVSRFSAAEQMPMDLPKPQDSRAQVHHVGDRVVINCRWMAGREGGGSVLYSLGPNEPQPLAVIADRLAVLKQESPDLKVVVRADRRLPYADVRAVMRVIAQNNIEMLNVAALVGEKD